MMDRLSAAEWDMHTLFFRVAIVKYFFYKCMDPRFREDDDK